MHIAIEGIDGVGKTSIAHRLAERLGFLCVEKHLHALLDGENIEDIPNYMRISTQVNASPNPTFRAWFYALGNLYLREHYQGKDIVTDRYFASNYSWNGTPENEPIFDWLIQTLGKPEMTFLIYADPAVREQRIRKRNPDDADLANATVGFSDRMYQKIEQFLRRHQLPYRIIDTSTIGIDEAVDQIIDILVAEHVILTLRQNP